MNHSDTQITQTWPGAIDLSAAYSGLLTVPASEYWLPGFPPNVVAGLIGATGSGKSWVALMLAHDWALQTSLTGILHPRTGRVIYLALEGGHEIPARLHAISRHLTPARRQQAHRHLQILDWSDNAVTEWSRRLASIELVTRDADMIIIDNFRRLHSYDENHSDDMSRVMGQLQNLAASSRTTLLILHHTPLAVDHDDSAPLRGRGSGAITNTWRWVGGLRRKNGASVLSVEVAHDGIAPGHVLGRFAFDVQSGLFRRCPESDDTSVPVNPPGNKRPIRIRTRLAKLQEDSND